MWERRPRRDGVRSKAALAATAIAARARLPHPTAIAARRHRREGAAHIPGLLPGVGQAPTERKKATRRVAFMTQAKVPRITGVSSCRPCS